MLEILWIIFFTRRIGRMAGERGYSAGGYRARAILFWFVPELVVLFLVLILTDSTILAYLLGLLAAVIASMILYFRVRGLKDKMPAGVASTAQAQWNCPQCGVHNTSWDQKCVSCGAAKPVGSPQPG